MSAEFLSRKIANLSLKDDQKRKLKFIFVTADKYPPFRVDVAVLFASELVSRGHQIDWILTAKEPCKVSYQTKWVGGKVWVGANCLETSVMSKLKSRLLTLQNDLCMFTLLRKQRYNFIQVKDKFVAALLGILTAKLNRTKFIYWLSYPYPEESLYLSKQGNRKYRWYHLLRGMFLKVLLYWIIMPQATHIFVQSEQMKSDLEKMGILAAKMTIVPMGVSLEDIPFGSSIEGTIVGNDAKDVVYIGTLSHIRRMDFLVRVFKIVTSKIPEAKLYLVGEGVTPDDEEILRKEASRLGISDKVLITGFLPRSEAWQYVSKANVCVSPIYPTPILNSGSPTKLIEYMAMGKAVVANDHPEQRLVISESGGGICVPYIEHDFAMAILELLENPVKAKEMGIKGRLYIEKHRNYKIIADKVENAYYEILDIN